MKKNIEIDIDELRYEKFENIVKSSDKTLNQVIMMLIKKTINADSLDWLYSNTNGEVQTKILKEKNAIELFRKKGHRLTEYFITFATKNTNNNVYWLNPDKRHLKEDWYIILNDNINKILYLFFVPKNSFKEFKMKNDRNCNLSIKYNDLSFEEIHTGLFFKKYLKDIIEYKTLV